MTFALGFANSSAIRWSLVSASSPLLWASARMPECPGFLTEHLLTMKIALPGGTYPRPEQTRAYLDRVMERLQTLPGVASVAAASTLPLSGESDWGTFLIADGARADWAKASAADWRGVSANYFETRHIPLRRGREFTPADEKNQ